MWPSVGHATLKTELRTEMIATKKFQPFRKRIKFLRALEGVFWGILVGSIIGIAWSILDWRGIVYFEWSQFGLLLLGSALVGAVIRIAQRVDDLSIARSLDRRAKLKDRLGTTAELGHEDSVFSQLQAQDASDHLTALKPGALYPITFKRIHILALAGIAVVAGILFLANSKLFLSTETVVAKESMQKESKRLEELRKAIFDDATDKKSTSPELLALQKDLLKLQKDFDKARIDPKEAMLRADELAKKANELAKQSALQELDKLKDSESMLEKMQKEELKKAGLEKADTSSVNMDDKEFSQKMDSAQQKSSEAQSKATELKNKLDALKSQLNKAGLDEKAKKDLESQIGQTQKDLENAMKGAEQAKKDLEAMQLSKEAREYLKKIYDDPIWKQILEKAKKIKASAEQAAKTGQPKLTKEERQQMQKDFEEFLKKMQDDDFRKAYLQKLLDSLKDGCST